VAVVQDDNNKILPIVYAVIESESMRAWLFFLWNLKRHVTSQHDLCLISDRHKSIKSAYSRRDSGWTTQNYVHVYWIQHITHNYKRRYKNNPIKKNNYQYGRVSNFFLFILNITSFCIIHNNEIVCLYLLNICKDKAYIQLLLQHTRGGSRC